MKALSFSLLLCFAGLNSFGGTGPIDELLALEVNDSKQWIFMRSEDLSKPVVLFIHGGPGSPLMPYARAWDAIFVNEFVIVHWDQRGSGKSFDPSASLENYNLQQVVRDGLRITEFLKEKFKRDTIVLVGHSWGSIVAANMAVASPKSFQSMVSVGTATDLKASDELRYEIVKKRILQTGDHAAKLKLDSLGSPPFLTATQLEEFGSLLLEHVGWKHTSYQHSMNDFIAAAQKSTEYTEAELVQAALGPHVWADAYATELARYNATLNVPYLPVPVFFAQGTRDLNTPTSLAKEYFRVLDAPQGKYWHEFEKSAHFPMYEESQKFLGLLKQASTIQPGYKSR